MRTCLKCGEVVEKETILTEYPYYCPECDENLYEFETEEN